MTTTTKFHKFHYYFFFCYYLFHFLNVALKKANMEYLGLISKRPLTQEDRARIVELQTTITNYGVSGIFTYFY
jgi:hypothetical protein